MPSLRGLTVPGFLSGKLYRISAVERVLAERLLPGDQPLQLAVFLPGTQQQPVAEADRTLLIKTAEWKEVSLTPQAMILVRTPPEGYDFRNLVQTLPVQRWLAIGITPLQLGLNLNVASQKPFVFRGIIMAFAPPLNQLRRDEALKRDFFWKCLKPLLQR